MSSFESLQERLAALQETTTQLRELIDRLANISFQPGSVPLSSSDEDNVATELSAEIHQVLREEEEDLELLQEEIIDLRAGRPGSEAEHRKTRLREGAQRLQAELKDCRTSFRKAQISARRSLEAAQKLERKLLLASYTASATVSPSSSTVLTNPDAPTEPDETAPSSSPSEQQPQHQTSEPPKRLTPEEARAQLFGRRLATKKKHAAAADDPQSAAINASNDITLALQRTHGLIAGELAKSAFATQTLAESTAALAELQQSYDGLDGLLARSRDLVGALATAQKSDTWYLQAALRLLLGTLAWLVFRRFFYGPLWWVVWLPLRTGYRVTKGVMPARGGVGGGGSGVVDTGSGPGVATMEVVRPDVEGGGTVVVGVGEEGVVPTIQVGQQDDSKRNVEGEREGGDDSMVEKVGRMVEDTLHQREGEDGEEVNRTAEGEEGVDDQGHPRKRLWAEGEVRDEL
ncbi:protein transport protein sec20 [Dichotomopilus funicola]|uniref:Protein transport protein sec20 n=1 Tax=Dichotomopilus funicola TaxID=1934379 RepID=A0AAN6UYN5_9PEZI|nr:protein transport protein sec20 [Dichotomopilus funicola]